MQALFRALMQALSLAITKAWTARHISGFMPGHSIRRVCLCQFS